MKWESRALSRWPWQFSFIIYIGKVQGRGKAISHRFSIHVSEMQFGDNKICIFLQILFRPFCGGNALFIWND